MKKLKRFILSARFMVALLALAQVAVVLFASFRFYTAGVAVYGLTVILNVTGVLYMSGCDDMSPVYKISWLVIMIVLPVAGAVLWALQMLAKRFSSGKKRIYRALHSEKQRMKNAPGTAGIAETKRTRHTQQINYLRNVAGAPVYKNTAVRYYATGYDYFRNLLDDMERAEKTIFLQYFVIDSGYMWDSVLDILEKKAAQGVDVRLIYDGLGCIANLPAGFGKRLKKRGIKVGVFNDVRFSFRISDYLMLNHRDHRKIAVIDSVIGYSGGINIADEYINYVEHFGQWKDTGFRLEGRAVYSLTATFLRTWELTTGEKQRCELFMPEYACSTDGLVQPYSDTPAGKNNICASVYINMINRAEKYVYIATPYLVVDEAVLTALTLAAGSGVDVRIVVPGIPDKWYVYCVTQSYYRPLVQAGVKIYQYTPGFVHAKMYVSDDTHAIVGGANTDYRSMYLNFENCCSFYGGSLPLKVKSDFEEMFDLCHQITEADILRTPAGKRICQSVFRLLAPLM